MNWYRTWIEQNEKNQMSHIWKETKCYYNDNNDESITMDQQQEQSKHKQEILLIEMDKMIECRSFTMDRLSLTTMFIIFMSIIFI